jgi:predicted PurR-regulated permease PerM
MVILKSAQSAYAQAREWSRDQIQSAGERLHIQEWDDFDELPIPSEDSPPPAAGAFQEQSMQNRLVEMVSRPAPFLPFALRTLGGGAMWLGQLMLFFMALSFLLLHGPGFWQDILASSPTAWRPTFAQLSQRLRTVLMATCVVHGLSALSAFFLSLPVFWIIVGVKYFVLLALLAGFFQFVPMLGSATLVSLLTVYFFATGKSLEGWECLILAFPLIVAVPDLLVRPYLAARFGKVHSMTMLAGFITGFEVFGVLGFVLGPLFLDLIVQFTNQVLRSRQTRLPSSPSGRP